MATILTKEQIRALYGATGKKGEVVAYGRAIKQPKNALPTRRKLQDMEVGSAEYNAEYDRLLKTPSKPAVRVIESEVNEIL